jgi:hypothetical protein
MIMDVFHRLYEDCMKAVMSCTKKREECYEVFIVSWVLLVDLLVCECNDMELMRISTKLRTVMNCYVQGIGGILCGFA